MSGSLTRQVCAGARLLLKHGRDYQEAVAAFQPSSEVLEPLPKVRQFAAGPILRRRKFEGANAATFMLTTG